MNRAGYIHIGLILALFSITGLAGLLVLSNYPTILKPISPNLIPPQPVTVLDESTNILPPENQNVSDLEETPATPPPRGSSANQITLTGEIACLPKTGPGPQTAECAIGLKTASGIYYGLKNLWQHDPQYKLSSSGISVRVSGTLLNEKSFGPGGSVYDTAGTINISSIRQISNNTPPPGSTKPLPRVWEDRVTMKEGDRIGPLLLQKIEPDKIVGLNFMEYPVARDAGTPVTLKIGESVSNGCTVTMTLLKIEGDAAVFSKATDNDRICPICLAEDTLVDTLFGEKKIQELKRGDMIWTANIYGKPQIAPIVEISKARVPMGHIIKKIVFENGQALMSSLGHPTADGRLVGELKRGDVLDGKKIIFEIEILYGGKFTYDILPNGETGQYYANGILIGSSLFGQ